MAVLQFPNAPTTGNKYPQPPVSGQPVYVYDGEKWKSDSNPPNVVTVSDTPPVGAVDGTMWWESDSGLLYIMYNDGSSRQWVIAAPQPDFSTYASKAYADVSAYGGLQINGGCEVSQENGTSTISVSGTGKYTLDGWVLASNGSQVTSGGQIGGAPPGFPIAHFVHPTTANAAPAAADRCALSTRIEGYRMARLAWGTVNAQPITIGFWVNAIRPGNYSGSVVNAPITRSYPFTFTINASGQWEYKTVTILGDTTGTWASANTMGMEIHFAVMLGTTYQAAAGAWASGVYYGTTGTINGVAATSDYFYITGVTVFPGLEGPSAARSPFVMRSYDQELEICQRYFLNYYGGTVGFFGSGTYIQTTVWFNQPMRAAPTITGNAGVIATMDWSAASNVNPSSNSIQQINVNAQSAEFRINNYTGLTLGQAGAVQPQGQAICKFDARL